MFVDFLYELRARKVPVGAQEAVAVAAALKNGLHDVSLDGFYKQLDHLVEIPYGNTGSGLVYGTEVLLRYNPDDRFFGWISYTLSRSERLSSPF